MIKIAAGFYFFFKATGWLYQSLRKLPSAFLLLVFISSISGCAVFLFHCFDQYYSEVSKLEKSHD